MTERPADPAPLLAMRTFIWGHFAWLILASLTLLLLGRSDHLAGLWLAGGINLPSLYPVLRFLQDSPEADQGAIRRLRAKLTLKFITVLATLGLLMYLRPALGVGVATAYAGMLPAILAVACIGIWQQRRHGSS